jgi:hypothetical protein
VVAGSRGSHRPVELWQRRDRRRRRWGSTCRRTRRRASWRRPADENRRPWRCTGFVRPAGGSCTNSPSNVASSSAQGVAWQARAARHSAGSYLDAVVFARLVPPQSDAEHETRA